MAGNNNEEQLLCRAFHDKLHWQLLMVGLASLSSMHTYIFLVSPNFYRVEVPYHCVDGAQIDDHSVAQDSCNTSCTGWLFSYSQLDVSSSIQESYNLVCDRDIFLKIHGSLFFLGLGIGSPFGGYLGDRIGRVKLLRLSNFISSIFGIIMALTDYFVLHAISWTIVSAFIVIIWIAVFSYVTEIGNVASRSKFASVLAVFFGFGYVICSLIALIFPNWRHLIMAISVIIIASFVISLFIDESPRWLWSEKRYQEVYEIWRKAQNIQNMLTETKKTEEQLNDEFSLTIQNGKCKQSVIETVVADLRSVLNMKPHLNENSYSENCSDVHNESEKLLEPESILGVFKYPRLIIRIILLIIYWVSINLLYYGLIFGAQMFGQNTYLFTIVQGLGAIIGAILSFFTLNLLGRKFISLFAFFCIGVSFLVCIFVPPSVTFVILPVTLIARVCLEIFGFLIFLWPAEMIPTTIRTSVLGLLALIAQSSCMILPFIETLSHYWESLPLLILCLFSFSSIIPVVFLPETMNEKLPENLREGNEFGVKKKQTKSVKTEVVEMKELETATQFEAESIEQQISNETDYDA